MISAELQELITHCPRLYHMAQRGAWPGISRHGLLSTTGLLDLFGVQGPRRDAIERVHRPEIVELNNAILGKAAIRDQSPMSDRGLRRVLPPDITPADWYARLNGMVFFWLSEKRLLRLSHAPAYRDSEHEILVLDTRRFIAAHGPKIWFCPINSGATKPFPAPRGHGTFQRIPDYDYARWKSVRPPGERVVELCVDHGVPDISPFIVDSYVMQAGAKIAGAKL
jgi:hypothetical protein